MIPKAVTRQRIRVALSKWHDREIECRASGEPVKTPVEIDWSDDVWLLHKMNREMEEVNDTF